MLYYNDLIQGIYMKAMTSILLLSSFSFLLSACTTESDPAPKCTTKAISYKEFKADYKPADGG